MRAAPARRLARAAFDPDNACIGRPGAVSDTVTTMKKADLEFLAKKVEGAMRREQHSDRYGAGSAQVHDRREQRMAEQAAGLVPYAVKLPQALVTTLQSLAQTRAASLNDITAELLRKALGESGDADKASPAPAPTQPVAAKAASPRAEGTARAATGKEPATRAPTGKTPTAKTPTAKAPAKPAAKKTPK
jgi:hypothetical protein